MSNDVATGAAETAAPVRIENVQLDLIAPDPDQVRKHFDQEALESLADSIRVNGIIQPIVARPDGQGGYSIIAGERRFRASQMAGRTDVPVIVRDDLVGKDVAVLQILENLQRQDLSLSETAAGVSHLVVAVGAAEAARQLGKSEAWISKHASVERLPDAVKQAIGDGHITSVDMAKDLGRLFEIDEDQAQGYLEDIQNPGDINPPPTRDEIRRAVLHAERRKQQAEEDAREEEQERSASISAGTPAGGESSRQLAKEKAEQEKRKAKVAACNAAKKICTEFADNVTVQVSRLAGVQPPKKSQHGGWEFNAPFRCAPPWFNEYDSKAPPTSPEQGQYSIDLKATFDVAEKALKAIGESDSKELDLLVEGEVTLAEAKAVAAILGKRLTVRLATKVPGKQLQGIVADSLKASTAPAAKAPPAKAKAGKPAAKKKVKAAPKKKAGSKK